MISLRAFHPDDEDRLVQLANNERVSRYLRDQFPRPYTHHDARYWIEEGSSNELGQHFAICLQGDCIGGLGVYWGKSEYQYSGEVGYWLGEPFWGKGFASEALGLFTDWLIEESCLQRFYALVLEANIASIKVLEKNGYQREAILQQSVYKHGSFHNEHLYARIRPALNAV